jgi:hypothetical protein
MALRPPRISEAEDQNADSDRRAQPIRPVWQGALIWVFGIGLLLVVVSLALRLFVVPALSGSSAPSAAEAHLGALQTQEALTPQPTTLPVRVPTTAPAVVPTAVLAPAAAPTAQPQIATPAATTAPTPPAALSATSSGATPVPTVAPKLAAEVSDAYLRYFQVSADALLKLDSSRLADVATDGELSALAQSIDDDRAQGRALKTDVQHNFVVLSVQNDEAEVADQFRDSSFFVDPVTQEVLPGQVIPNSPDTAPLVRIVYRLQRIDGTWKVTAGTKYE